MPRPDEPVVDQGARFDLETLVSRRGALTLVGLGGLSAALAACAPTTTVATPTSTPSSSATGSTSGEIPEETAGPYPGDGSNGPDVLEQAGVVRRDITGSLDGGTAAVGVPMVLTLTLLDMAQGDVPFEGVAVYVWHCDAQGGYSMYSTGIEGETYLRGVQVAGSDGTVSFDSIVPGCYSGRWPHIHFEVYPDVASITDSTAAIRHLSSRLACGDVRRRVHHVRIQRIGREPGPDHAR
ncbi:MAG: hypothetical protein R2715_25215 [Ilumatobacteraceae bacterium]